MRLTPMTDPAIPPTRRAVAPGRDELSMQIYAAMLGDSPAIERPTAARGPRLNLRVRVEARLDHVGASPFHQPTLGEHVGRCAAYAVRALDEARERLNLARPKPIGRLADPLPPAADATPIVLIGPAARRETVRDLTRAA